MNLSALSRVRHFFGPASLACAFALAALPGCDASVGTGGGAFISGFDSLGDGAAIEDAGGNADTTKADDTAAVDVILPDAGGKDVAVADSGVKDIAVADSGPEDTGPADTGPADTGPADTGTADTGPTDTGPNCSKTDYTKVQAIFLNNCNGCHGHQFGTSCSKATSDKSIKSKVNNGSMPPGGFSNPADKALVLKWYTDGTTCTPAPGCP